MGIQSYRDLGQQVRDAPSLAYAGASRIPSWAEFVRTAGYAEAGDGGGALYVAVGSEPSHAGKFQDIAGSWFELAEKVVDPRMLGAKFDDSTDDTVAWQNTWGIGRPIRCTPGASRISAQIGEGNIPVFGCPSASVGIPDISTIIRVTKGGVTPFVGIGTQACFQDLVFSYSDTGTTPTGSLTYAKAYKITASIAESGGELILTVTSGDLVANASVGSLVVAISDTATKDFDYYVNNFTSMDRVFVIKEITSTTTAKLYGKAGSSISSQSMYVRGNCIALLSPSAADFVTGAQIQRVQCSIGPGCLLVSTGGQKIHIKDVHGGGHMAVFYLRDDVTGAPYHHLKIDGAMNFNLSCMHTFADGLTDSRLLDCQFDPGITDIAEKNTYFQPPIAVYDIRNANSLLVEGNTLEHTGAPVGFRFDTCTRVTWDKSSFNEYTGVCVEYVNCSNMREGDIRRAGTLGSTVRTFTTMNLVSNDVARVIGGEDGLGYHTVKDGAGGTFAPALTVRDEVFLAFTLTQATLKANASHTYTWNIPYTSLSGWGDVSATFLTALLFEHGAAWTSTSGTPQVDIGIPTDTDLIADNLALNVGRRTYMDQSQIPSFKVGALMSDAVYATDGSTGLRLTFYTGDNSVLMNSANFTCSDFKLYVKVERVRT